jgi:hypothetical protein
MTGNSPLTRSSLSSSAPAAVQLLTRQSLTPLSQIAFLSQLKLFCEAKGKSCSDYCCARAVQTYCLEVATCHVPHAKAH